MVITTRPRRLMARGFRRKRCFILRGKLGERDPEGPPLFIGYEDWFRAFLAVTGRTEHTAPQFALLSYQHQQNMEVDYRLDRVIREVKEGADAGTGCECAD